MTMIIPDAPELETMTFGTDDAIARVLAAMIDHENTDAGAVLYGVTGWTDAITAYYALQANGSDVARTLANRAFRYPRSYFLDAEWSATLFESLTDYATGESVCDANADTHAGYAGDLCECERRDHAWTWAASIAEVAAGIELI